MVKQDANKILFLNVRLMKRDVWGPIQFVCIFIAAEALPFPHARGMRFSLTLWGLPELFSQLLGNVSPASCLMSSCLRCGSDCG